MRCYIEIWYPDGSHIKDDEFGVVDFDYFTIRQYRKLIKKFKIENEKFLHNCRLVFVPVEEIPFETFNKYQIKVKYKNKKL